MWLLSSNRTLARVWPALRHNPGSEKELGDMTNTNAKLAPLAVHSSRPPGHRARFLYESKEALSRADVLRLFAVPVRVRFPCELETLCDCPSLSVLGN